MMFNYLFYLSLFDAYVVKDFHRTRMKVVMLAGVPPLAAAPGVPLGADPGRRVPRSRPVSSPE
jgi:hypothetical protein